MVNSDNYNSIESLDIVQLEHIVTKYPWFSLARVKLLEQLREVDKESFINKFRDSSAFIPNADYLYNRIIRNAADVNEVKPEIPSKQIYIVGGDYFSMDDLNQVKEESPIEKVGEFVPKGGNEPLIDFTLQEQIMSEEDFNSLEFYTETLAKIFTEQECYTQAIEVYEKLSLLYPEKSAYFADFINEIKLKNI